MDNEKIGILIKSLRLENNMTQKNLAEKLSVSDRTVSKWERGLGCPDVSLVNSLAEIFGVDTARLLEGEMPKNPFSNGNLKRASFSVCPVCGNVMISTGNAEAFCCGRKLLRLSAAKPDEPHDVKIEPTENEWFVTSSHPMEKDHYISFAATLTGNKIDLIKFYPEWALETYIPRRSHGTLLWYCTKHGLFYKNI
jgi:DNA-binding XRE family transcriptional regulator